MLPIKKSSIFSLLGEISVKFSNLEFVMSTILAKLIDTSAESIAGSFIVDDFTLFKKIDLIRRLARYRFAHADVMSQQIDTFCDSIDKVRGKRNLFIHGQWCFNQKDLDIGKISVYDMRWKKEDKKLKHWSRGRKRLFTEKDLSVLSKDIEQLVHEAIALSGLIKSSEMTPHWQQNRLIEQGSTPDKEYREGKGR